MYFRWPRLLCKINIEPCIFLSLEKCLCLMTMNFQGIHVYGEVLLLDLKHPLNDNFLIDYANHSV